MSEPYPILNRWTQRPLAIAQIECSPTMPEPTKLGLAVQWAIKADVVLYGADLHDANLAGADLRNAKLSSSNLRKTDLSRTNLSGTELFHTDLTDAKLAGADLSSATLTDADLYEADLSGANLIGANLLGANMTDANLSGANLSETNLTGADLSGVNLIGVDLAGIDIQRDIPIIPNIDAAILAAIEVPGNALDMSQWHTCQTTHCRAGWAITLAGEAGKALEEKLSPVTAGALIYAASRAGKRIPNFYADDETTLDDLRACAADDGAR